MYARVVLGLLVLLTGFPSAAQAESSVVTVATFDPLEFVFPGGLAIDKRGNICVTLAVTGEIRRFGPDGTQSALATFQTGFFTGFGFLGAVALNVTGEVYVSLASFNSPGADAHGLWRIRGDGSKELFAALPVTDFAHGLAFDGQGDLFISNAFQGTISRITPDGQVSLWLDDPLLKPDPGACPPVDLPFPDGPGNLAFDTNGTLYTTNVNRGLLIRIPVDPDGTAGTPEVVLGPDCANLEGGDGGLAIDVLGNLYLATERGNRVLRLTPDGVIETLASAADGLDNPHAVAFGTTEAGQKQLYFTNFASLTFLGGGDPKPSLMKIDVGVGPAILAPLEADVVVRTEGFSVPADNQRRVLSDRWGALVDATGARGLVGVQLGPTTHASDRGSVGRDRRHPDGSDR